MLPKFDLPKYNTILPASKRAVSFRPFTVKEEKIMLLAKETGQEADALQAVYQIIENCSGEDPKNLAIVDVEWMFIQLRIRSVGETSSIRYICKNTVEEKRCGAFIDYDLDLNTVVVEHGDSIERVELDETRGLSFQFPTFEIANDLAEKHYESKLDAEIEMMYRCLNYIYDGDNLIMQSDISQKEFDDWVTGLPRDKFELVRSWFDTNPILKKDIVLECPKCGNKTDITLKGLRDFF